MVIWLALAATGRIPIFVLSLKDFLIGTHSMSGDISVGILVPPVMIVFGIMLPTVGRWLTRSEETNIVDFLLRILSARLNIQPHDNGAGITRVPQS
jgi:hypothetical protein